MTEEWGPWIEHDGAEPEILSGSRVQIVTRGEDHLISPRWNENLASQHPCWFWRWRTIRDGFFKTRLKRVCDDPAYAPIIRYRIHKPRGMVILENLLADLPQEVDA